MLNVASRGEISGFCGLVAENWAENNETSQSELKTINCSRHFLPGWQHFKLFNLNRSASIFNWKITVFELYNIKMLEKPSGKANPQSSQLMKRNYGNSNDKNPGGKVNVSLSLW